MTTKSGTTDIDLTSAPRYKYLGSIVVTAGADAAVVHVRDGTASGTILCTIKAALETTAGASFHKPVFANSGLYIDLASGTTPQIMVQVDH